MASSSAANPSGDFLPADSHCSPLIPGQTAQALRQHLALCRELLAIVQRENRALQGSEPFDIRELADARKSLLSRLSQAYKSIKEVSFTWQQLDPAERQSHVEVSSLIRQNQDVIMNVVLLDRENERAMLRRGLIPNATLASEIRQRSHFVADLYRVRGKSM